MDVFLDNGEPLRTNSTIKRNEKAILNKENSDSEEDLREVRSCSPIGHNFEILNLDNIYNSTQKGNQENYNGLTPTDWQ